MDIILKGIEIKEKSSEKAVLNETYRKNLVEVLQHLTALRSPRFSKHVANGKAFKIVVQGSKLPDNDAPWVRTESTNL